MRKQIETLNTVIYITYDYFVIAMNQRLKKCLFLSENLGLGLKLAHNKVIVVELIIKLQKFL